MPMYTRFDPVLDGSWRFAYAVGNNVSTLVDRTVTYLDEAVTEGNTVATCLDVGLDDLTGCVVLINNQETVVINKQEKYLDSATDRNLVNYSFETPVKFNHLSNTRLDVESFEVFLFQGAEIRVGQRVIQLSSTRPIVAGDRLAKLVNTDFNAVMSDYFEIESVVLDSSYGNVCNYTVTLMTTLSLSVQVGERLFIKATAAYQSNKLPLNMACSSAYVDTTSGKTFGQGQADTVFGVTLYGVSGEVLGFQRLPRCGILTLKALTVQELSVFEVRKGSIRIGNELTCLCDLEGLFALGSTFPEMLLDLNFDVSGSGTLIVETDVVETITVLNAYRYTRKTTASKLIIRFVGKAGSVVVFNNVSTSGSAHSMQYTMVSDTAPGESFETSGLILKPTLRSYLDCSLTSQLLELNSGFVL